MFVQINLIVVLLVVIVNSFIVDYYRPKVGECTFALSKTFGKPSPLFLVPGTTKVVQAIDGAGTISLSKYQNVQLVCTGAKNYLNVKGVGVKDAIATCVEGTTFLVDNQKYEMKNLTCSQWPEHVTIPVEPCYNNNTLIKFGFNTTNGFVYSMETCHDTEIHHTFYTKFILTKAADGSQPGVERSDWQQGEFFEGINPTNLYRRVTQLETISKLLGSKELGEKYISQTSDYFLSKGHMTAKGDYLYGTHQLSTFWYMNAAPQWQTFNGRNWNAIETDVRWYAAFIQEDLEVYTGTHGIATLPDINNNEVDLYLSAENDELKMPVPRMYWKVMYHRETQAGTAFIGLNNPYQTNESIKNDIFCRDVCEQMSWLTWLQKDVQRGYSFCCEVNEFRKFIPHLPPFIVTSLLV